MKKCSLALKKRVTHYTDVIFNECICQVFNLDKDDEESIRECAYEVRTAIHLGKNHYVNHGSFNYEELAEKRDKVSAMYQDKVKTLPTKQLNEILKAHELQGGLRRAAKTIETIVSELARRAIFDDSGESEYTDDDGDVDGLRSKSKKHSKKTTSKGRKTSKGRRRH